jgi:hypothetical protein
VVGFGETTERGGESDGISTLLEVVVLIHP